jgi:hypothetical protein
MTGPAHLPLLKPQQPEAQSASLLQGPVMNWAPLPEPVLELPDEEAAALALGSAAAGRAAAGLALGSLQEPLLPVLVPALDDVPVGAAPVKPRATAALSLGDESPNPQPPSRSWATIGPVRCQRRLEFN